MFALGGFLGQDVKGFGGVLFVEQFFDTTQGLYSKRLHQHFDLIPRLFRTLFGTLLLGTLFGTLLLSNQPLTLHKKLLNPGQYFPKHHKSKQLANKCRGNIQQFKMNILQYVRMSGLVDLLDLADVLLVEDEEVFGVMAVADYFGE